MRTTFRPASRSLLMASTELVFGPMVQTIEVRRRLRSGWYAVSSCASHSILPLSWRWSRAVAIVKV
jgi:hypothetical protein